MTQKYDLIIIGGGPGGYLAAERAARGGLKTLLLEKRALGGVCLNEGCIPSKTLLQSAKTYRHALDAAAYGVTCGNVSIDQQAVKKRKDKVVGMLVSGVRGKMASAGVTVVMENAVITGKTSDGFTVAAGGTTYTGKELILATGSSPAIPPIPGIKENLGSFVLTNREILELTQIPKRLTVIGGGVIGLEMAAYFASVGGEVTVVEQLEHIAGSVDRELGRMLQRELERQGVTFLLGHSCLSVTPGSVTVQTPEGAQRVLEADKVLLSVGRRPNTRELGLETVGVSFTPGGIPTDTQCRTNVPGIWAIGDVNGHHMLAHTAYREAEVAVNNILGQPDAMRYHANPSVIYTSPELACVGKTEEECKEKGIAYEKAKLSMRYSGRFVAENEGADGICKILIDKKRRTVLGVHLLGSYSGEIIWGAAQMIEMQLRVKDARQIIFPHPTVSEIIKETLWEFPD